MRGNRARVVGLTVPMAAAGTALAVWSSLRWGIPVAPLHIPWFAFVPVYVLTNVLVIQFEMRHEAHTFTLSELPLVAAFFFAAPGAVILGRLLGEALYFGVRRRQAPTKLAFNLSMFLLETGVALSIFHLLYHGHSPLDPAAWPIALLAVAAADLVSLVSVTVVIRWHGGQAHLAGILGVGAVTAVVNVSLSILAAVVLWVAPAGLVLFAIVALVTAAAYRGYTTLKQRYANLQLLYDFTKVVGASLRSSEDTARMLAETRRLLRAGLVELVILGPDGSLAGRERDSDPSLAAELEAAPPVVLGQESVWARVLSGGESVLVTRSGRSALDVQYRAQLRLKDAILAPLMSGGSVVGAIMVGRRLGDVSTFDQQDRRLFETMANHVSVAIENGRLVEELRREADERRHEALHDALTGLPNRALFSQRVKEAVGPRDPGPTVGGLTGGRPPRPNETAAAVMLMDLDRFKEVNDTLGHHNGDLLLREVATRLHETVRGCDTVARLGGDEFALLLPELHGPEQARELAARVLSALSRPFVVDGLSLEIGASIGIALSPEHGDDGVVLLQRADVAMYNAKAAKEGCSVYTAERDNYSPKRLALATELRRAIDTGQLVVYHQPKVDITTEAVVGTEALVRWSHPDYGMVFPDEFIPVAEQTGLIVPLTLHVLDSALAQCSTWRAGGHGVGVAVNLAVRSLLDTSLPDTVNEALARHGVPARMLTLEITESSIMADADRTISVLERLALIGVKLSVDDFGTGYSSLTYLQRLPVHEVKIDKSFVMGMGSDANAATIVQSIVELGHNLGLRVVAEGVEDDAVWRRLQAMSCDIAQGYLLSRPAPAADITSWLVEWPLRRQVDELVTSAAG